MDLFGDKVPERKKLTLRECSRLSGLPYPKIQSLALSGKLKGTCIGDRFYVERSDLRLCLVREGIEPGPDVECNVTERKRLALEHMTLLLRLRQTADEAERKLLREQLIKLREKMELAEADLFRLEQAKEDLKDLKKELDYLNHRKGRKSASQSGRILELTEEIDKLCRLVYPELYCDEE